MQELIEKIAQLPKQEVEKLTLIKALRIWKPQIFEFFEKKHDWRKQIFDDKIRKKLILGKTEKDVITNELEDLAEIVCDESSIILLKKIDGDFEGILDLIQMFDLYYQTFTYEVEENEELSNEKKAYIEQLSNCNFMRICMGKPLIDLPERFLAMQLIGYNSISEEFKQKIEKDFQEYLYSTLPSIPQITETKLIKTIVELWYDNKYYEALSERLNTLNEKENSSGQLESNEAKLLNQEQQLTIAQKVLSIMILNKFKILSKSQDRIDLQNFIYSLTGNKHRSIGDFMAKFDEKNKYLSHSTKKQNLKDYLFVRHYFENLNLKDCIEFIDNQIIMINKLNE